MDRWMGWRFEEDVMQYDDDDDDCNNNNNNYVLTVDCIYCMCVVRDTDEKQAMIQMNLL